MFQGNCAPNIFASPRILASLTLPRIHTVIKEGHGTFKFFLRAMQMPCPRWVIYGDDLWGRGRSTIRDNSLKEPCPRWCCSC